MRQLLLFWGLSLAPMLLAKNIVFELGSIKCNGTLALTADQPQQMINLYQLQIITAAHCLADHFDDNKKSQTLSFTWHNERQFTNIDSVIFSSDSLKDDGYALLQKNQVAYCQRFGSDELVIVKLQGYFFAPWEEIKDLNVHFATADASSYQKITTINDPKAIHVGESGSAMFDQQGRIIGVTSCFTQSRKMQAQTNYYARWNNQLEKAL